MYLQRSNNIYTITLRRVIVSQFGTLSQRIRVTKWFIFCFFNKQYRYKKKGDFARQTTRKSYARFMLTYMVFLGLSVSEDNVESNRRPFFFCVYHPRRIECALIETINRRLLYL